MEPNNQIEEIKDKVDIVQVVQKYVHLKQAGKNFSGLCPFHKEKTPSFIVSPDIQRYKCFGCGKSGDIFNFLQEIEHIDFVEALEKLAKVAGVQLKKTQGNKKYKELKDIHYIATKYYYNTLLRDKTALEYVLNRGINRESIKNFAIGYSPKYPKLLEQVKKSGAYSKGTLLQTGLFVEKNGVLREKFFDRIMFPIRSRKGDVIAFTARQSGTNEYGPKYMNSPETPIFHKSYNLFAQYESRQEMRKSDLAIISEGSTDVISAHQHGVKNVVAPLGTSLTSKQLESIIPLTKNILFLFDSDRAGQQALIRGFILASELSMNPYAASTAPYKDIDDLLQKEPEKFEKIIKEKKEAFSYILAEITKGKDMNKLSDVNTIRKEIKPILDSVKDRNTKNLYLKKLYRVTGIQLDDEKIIDSKPNYKDKKTETKKIKRSKTEDLTTRYIQLLLFVEKIEDSFILDSKYITDKHLKKIYLTIKKNLPKINRTKLFEEPSTDAHVAPLLEDMIFNAKTLPTEQQDIAEDIHQTMKRIRVTYYEGIQKNLASQISISEELEKEDEKAHALSKLQEVTKVLQKIKNE